MLTFDGLGNVYENAFVIFQIIISAYRRGHYKAGSVALRPVTATMANINEVNSSCSYHAIETKLREDFFENWIFNNLNKYAFQEQSQTQMHPHIHNKLKKKTKTK